MSFLPIRSNSCVSRVVFIDCFLQLRDPVSSATLTFLGVFASFSRRPNHYDRMPNLQNRVISHAARAPMHELSQ